MEFVKRTALTDVAVMLIPLEVLFAKIHLSKVKEMFAVTLVKPVAFA